MALPSKIVEGIKGGIYKNIVVLTGAGVSTAAGIPDFRSPGNISIELLTQFSISGLRWHVRHTSPGIDNRLSP
jgi:NAD-dependent SIR2 family protein deacetylase